MNRGSFNSLVKGGQKAQETCHDQDTRKLSVAHFRRKAFARLHEIALSIMRWAFASDTGSQEALLRGVAGQ